MCNNIPHATKQLVTKCLLSSTQFLQFPLLELEYLSFSIFCTLSFEVLDSINFAFIEAKSDIISASFNFLFALSNNFFATLSNSSFFFLATAKSSCSAFLFQFLLCQFSSLIGISCTDLRHGYMMKEVFLK